MTTKEMAKPRYRVPTVSVDAYVSLDEFSIDEIVKYLRYKGGEISGVSGGGLLVCQDDLNRIETLAVCGQLDAARTNALEIISEAIGRKL